jgi:hypothetical protein
MISAAVEPPSPPVARAPVQRAGAKGREASAFDDALRDQEASSLETEKDDLLLTSDAAPDPSAAAPQPQLPAPVALDALIAQVLPPPPQPQQQAQPREIPQEPPLQRAPDAQAVAQNEGRATALPNVASSPRIAKTRDDADDTAPAPVADAPDTSDEPRRADAPTTPGQTFRAQKDGGEAQASPVQDSPSRGASAFTPAHDAATPGDANGRKTGQDESSTAQTRSVAVRKVTTANHFPVTADPIRQIAAHITRALDAPAAPTAALPDASSQPVKTISVTLEPESLGAVTLRMRLSGNQLSVRVDVAEPATLELIQRDRDRLQKSMTSDNVSIDRLEIRAANEPPAVQGGDNANAPKQDMNAPGQQSRQQSASPGGEQRSGSRSQSQPQPQQQQTRINGQDNDSPRGSDSRNLYL